MTTGRRDYWRRALRRFADGDVAGPERTSCAGGRSCLVPDDTVSPHVVHPLGAAARKAAVVRCHSWQPAGNVG